MLVIVELFQFHYGTIKSFSSCSAEGTYWSFQFHYGTIKSGGVWVAEATVNKFQFHYGTIKSGAGLSVSGRTTYFNSTMVRLKGRLVCTVRIVVHISIPLWYD